jgi:hypothetical protein
MRKAGTDDLSFPVFPRLGNYPVRFSKAWKNQRGWFPMFGKA